MSTVLEQQGEIIDVIEGDAAAVEKDLETGHVSKRFCRSCSHSSLLSPTHRVQHTDKAVVSARAARKKRWICFFITLIILIIIGAALGITLRPKH